MKVTMELIEGAFYRLKITPENDVEAIALKAWLERIKDSNTLPSIMSGVDGDVELTV